MKKFLIALSLPYIVVLFIAATPLYDIVRVETTDRTQVGSKVILDNTNNEFYAYRIWLGGEFRTNWIPFSTQANWNTAWYWVNENSNDVAQITTRTSSWDLAYIEFERLRSVKTISSTTVLDVTYGTVWLDTTSTNVGAVLPVANAMSGKVITVVYIKGTNEGSVNLQSGNKLNNQTNNFILYAEESLSAKSDGTNDWWVQ